MSTISVLGTGLMGSAVASTLIDAGHTVTVWNRSADKSAPLVAKGARRADTVAEAINASDITFSHVLSSAMGFDLVRAAEGEIDWNGKVFVNLSTGTPDGALAFGGYLTSRGGGYADGVISAYPDDIGTNTAIVQYAASDKVWATLEPIAKIISPAAYVYVGSQLDAPNVIDPAVTGAVYSVGYGAFLESAAYVASRGIAPKHLIAGADKMIDLLRHSIHASIELLEKGSWASDQSTVDAYHAAVIQWRDTMLESGNRAAYFGALLENLEAAREAGYGQLGFHTQFKTAVVAPVAD
ncbi:NAD(P)-binding domain-containing protein [Rhodococcus rhodochrous]|uniref:NAD(P)-binding domain-containing protein n=2 Tax=Mycobacteriales TaxID=85007 RepID=UPI00226CB8AC|nr:NAD(P)-binding domain-containing protein [Rhodococcus rhodochrous]MCB8913073.1 NAD(P)-binding domain-containing protein [Rhodococcus rhodochrous]